MSLHFHFQTWNLCAWTLLAIVMPAIVFAGSQSNSIPNSVTRPIQFALYETLGRIVWSIAMCYVIFACIHSSGGPINSFLSLSMWQPLAKLSYGIYLVHSTILTAITASTKTPQYFNEFTEFQNFISFFVLSTLVAIPLTLAFELPIDAISKLNIPIKDEKFDTRI